jgi:lipopolysaccharide heptosyltransferase II
VSGDRPRSGLTILQVLSWLNYGGVERYSMRLARALQERGHRVLIASSGGQLVPELEAYGIEHREVDFTGWRTLSGMLALRRLLEREQVDLVNAHNWRAGMVASLACGLAGVPYVLTVHGTRRPVHRHGVFYWSKRVVAVSEASKRNLVSGFGLPDERVLRSIVGVECDRFHPGPAGAALEAELGLRPGAPRVVHVSRFSHSKAPVALALIRAMETLSQQCPGLELVLVGQGPEEAAVAREAEAMNQRLGRRAVFALGGRSDIPQVLRLAAVVVATASVALEAMASGKPLVAAGKCGYVGPVTPENLSQAEATCFGDHAAAEATTPEGLSRDLAALLGSSSERARLGSFGRQAAESQYGLSRLGEEVEGMYRQALCERSQIGRILVFHLNQIGDLMFTLPALKALREAFPRAQITSVLRPHLAGLISHSGLVDDIIPRPPGGPSPTVSLARRLRRLRPDLAIAFSQSATMAWCAWVSAAAHRVGYVDSDLSRLLNHRVQVRGIPCPAKVMRLVRSLGLAPGKWDYLGLVRLSPEDDADGARLLSESELAGRGPLIALAPGESSDRAYKSWSTPGFTRLASALAREYEARLVVVGGERDRALGDEIIAGAGVSAANLAGRTSPSQLAALLARCDLLIGIDSGPMHVAAAMGRPVVGLFGPTSPGRTGPLGEGHQVVFHRQPCWPCMSPTCVDRPCMSSITVDEVLAAVRQVLARPAPVAGS